MKKLALVKYEMMTPKYELFSDFTLGIALKGTCIYNGELCAFATVHSPLPKEFDKQKYVTEWKLPHVTIYSLSSFEKYLWTTIETVSSLPASPNAKFSDFFRKKTVSEKMEYKIKHIYTKFLSWIYYDVFRNDNNIKLI